MRFLCGFCSAADGGGRGAAVVLDLGDFWKKLVFTLFTFCFVLVRFGSFVRDFVYLIV